MSWFSPLISGGAGDIDSYTKLLLHMEGPDSTNTVIDASPARNGVAGHGDNTKVVLISLGKFGSALRFANNYSQFQYSEDYEFDAGDFTIDWWENRSDKADSRPSIVRSPEANGGYQAFLLGWSYGTTAIGAWQNAYFSLNGTAWDLTLDMGFFVPDRWYHLAIVRKGTTVYAFRDGVLQSQGTLTGALMRAFYGLMLGYYYNGTGVYMFYGNMDEVRVTKGKAIWTQNFTPPNHAYGPSEDVDVRLLLHFNDSNNSRAIIDASPRQREAAMVVGNPVISTAQSKFGGSSLLFPGGEGQYISFPDSADWRFNDQQNMTLDCWIRFSSMPTAGGAYAICSQSDEPTGLWIFLMGSDGNVYWLYRTGSTDYTVAGPVFLTQLNTWHHVALVRQPPGGIVYGDYRVYVNGVGGSVVSIPNMVDFNSPLYIGTWKGAAYGFNGYIDEFRVSRTTRWTNNFTPPTAPHLPVDKASPATTLLAAESPYDKSSHRHGGWIVANGVTLVAGGQAGGRACWNFNGSASASVQFPHHSDWEFGNRDWTVEWWEYRQSATGCIVARDNISTNGGYTPFLLGYGHGGNERSCFLSSNNNGWDIINNTDGGTFGVCPLNVWTHFAIERIRDNTIWLFVNGTIINGKNIPPGISLAASSNPLSIATYANYAYPLLGYIDDLRISNFGRYELTGFTPSGPYPGIP